MFSISTRRGLLASAAVLTLTLAGQALAQTRDAVQTYDIKAQDLGRALAAVAQISGREVIAPSDLVAGRTAPALRGRYGADQAFERLLANSALVLVPVGDKLIVRRALSTAQGEPQAGDPEVLSELVVTGTRIRGAAPVGANLISITREDIVASGYATTQQIVQALPQNYGGGPNDTTFGQSIRNGAGLNSGRGASVNLRGLGSTSTLVLIDGSRPAMGGASGVFADLSLVPSSAVERVEVLADGASALYGSDAVAGVVNLRMRQRFSGGETSVRYGSANGDLSEVSASQIFGKQWNAGRLVLAYEYYQRDALKAADRSYATEDLRSFGDLDYRNNFGAPGTIVAGGRNFAIPGGQTGAGLTVGQLRADQVNRGNSWLNADLSPRQRRHSIYASAAWDPNSSLNIFGALLAARRDFSQATAPDLSTATVPTTNPFYLDPIGTRQPVRVQYNFESDLGHRQASGRVSAIDLQLGATQHFGPWSATISSGFGEQVETTRIDNQLNTFRLSQALADINPSTTYNVFGAARTTSQATIDKVRGYTASRGLYDVWTVSGKADGPLFRLPAGDVRLAIGGEIRDERYKQTTLSDIRGAAPSITGNAYPGGRRISAGYAELLIPVIGEGSGIPSLQSLDVSLAGRVEDYSDFGTTANPKVGIDWKISSDLSFKGSFGTSFRAPSFRDEIQGPNYVAYQPVAVPDPLSPTGSTIVLGLLGNPPKLDPERARTYTAGLTWRPKAVEGLKLGATYFRVAYRDRISDPNANFFNLLNNAATYASLINRSPSAAEIARYYADPLLLNPSNIPASDIKVILDARVSNLAKVVIDGLDLDFSYVRPFAGGALRTLLTGSEIFGLRQAATASAPMSDVVGTVGNPAKRRLRGQAGWSGERWDGTIAVNYVSGYSNQTITPAAHVSAWTTADAQVGYRLAGGQGLLSGVRVSLSVSNIFDRDPPFIVLKTVNSTIGYDADNASPVGRLVAVQVVKSW
ncbi:TonB-dependent receptor [Caulobacter sp.]|uniref:TonB-dependent receptor n=1 Tax=Caulobacter sp. TaxID=78 RepID=UPI0031D7C2D5